jgi:hypothetical protein
MRMGFQPTSELGAGALGRGDGGLASLTLLLVIAQNL